MAFRHRMITANPALALVKGSHSQACNAVTDAPAGYALPATLSATTAPFQAVISIISK